jgi:hypothetical protein
MQEEILSRRLLVFINGQVYYQCANGEFSEAQNWSGQRRPSSGLHVSLYSTLLLYPDITFSQFSTMITYYTSRTLSFQNDVLRASQGMLQKLAMLSGARSFEGLPAPLDRSLVFELLGSPRNKQVDRRQSFPSYSWTGWMNAVRYDHRLESPENISRDDSIDKNDPVLRGWIIWHCTLEDGKVYRIDDTGRLRKRLLLTVEDTQSKSREAFQKIPVSASDINFTAIRATSYPLLLFWTICVNLCLTRRPTSYEITDKIDPRIVENRHAFDVIDRYGTKCGTADIASTMPEAAEGKFALLTMYEGYFWAILLGWEDDIAERRGVARLSAEAIEVCLDPGPRWKAIVLG